MKFPKLKNKAFLAPMAGITDIAFRAICTEYGAAATTTELVSAKGLLQGNSKTDNLIKRDSIEKNFGIQLFGGEVKSLTQAAQKIEKKCSFIDINMGCPAPKVIKTSAGSALLTKPELIKETIKNISNSVSIPVTVKIRTGITDNTLAVKAAIIAENAGASLITVHGRTKAQGYSGIACWKTIKQVKDAVSVPVVGNGDINSPESAKEKLQITDLIAIGRATSGNPYLFTQINDFLKNNSYKENANSNQLKIFKDYLKLANKYNTSFTNQKLQAQRFIKGVENSAKARLLLNNTKNSEELLENVQKLLK